MSKPTVDERLEEIDIQIKLNKNYGIQYTSHTSDGVLAAMQTRIRKLERERERLLNPQPKSPRKRATKPPASAATVATFTPDTVTGNRRGRSKS